jgi:hypothetical protein
MAFASAFYFMDIITLLILSLATWRVSSLFVVEDGPFKMFAKLRGKITLFGLLSCLWCLSVWVGAAVIAAWYFVPFWTVILCAPFAVSGAAIMIDRYINA